jgi:putative cardiolipin synthase
MLSEADGLGQRHLVWRTLENGKPVDFDQEPAATPWLRLKVDMLSLLPLDELL